MRYLSQDFQDLQSFKSSKYMKEKLTAEQHIQITNQFSAPNYAPLPVVLSKGKGAWVWDVNGKKYLDMLSAFGTMSFGHSNDRIIKRAYEQMNQLSITSRAFYTEQGTYFAKALAEFAGMESVLLMNSGAEAVETSVKCARRWGYERKGVAENQAEIICFDKNFHGRTVTAISMSDSPDSRKGYGPYTPGFILCPFGDIQAVEKAISKNTVAVLFEPIQGEGGINVPPAGFVKALRDLCTSKNVLMIADEIWTSLGRTGKRYAIDHENVTPDMYLMGKSLGGGLVPISAVVSKRDILSVFTPGSHGSTIGGNPLACAIADEVLALYKDEGMAARSAKLGDYAINFLRSVSSKKIKEVRGRGLFLGVELHAEAGPAKKYCEKLLQRGLLCKDTRVQTLRIAPTLVIEETDLKWALEQIIEVLT
jgi:ornithine--oxo-acid transaminase